MMHQTFPVNRERSAEECLFWFPQIARVASNNWARDFANSILAQSRRRGWRPSEKQLHLMRRMVSEWFAHRPTEGDDLPLIEGI